MILIALVLALVVLWRAGRRPGGEGRGCRWFWAWSLVGAGLCFSFLTGFSIGLFVLPFALLLLWFVLSRAPRWRESIGFVEGVGLVLLLIAYLNRDYRPCGAGPQIGGAGASYSCGGFDPHPWLYTGVALAGLATVAYAVARQLSRPGEGGRRAGSCK
jgi:hypothetical protein